MSEEIKSLFQQFVNGMNNKDNSFLDRLVNPNFIDHQKEKEPILRGS